MKILTSNKKAVVTLESEAFQLVVKILLEKGYENLVNEIVDNTKIVEL